MSAARFWFVVWIHEPKTGSGRPSVSNTALAGMHPTAWISSPPTKFRKHYTSHLLSFHEIDQETFEAIDAAKYIGCEDYRDEPAEPVRVGGGREER